ncbi:GNAT family N-acetyltransferase [Muricauda ruestringensis]|uniref:GNAT family N-acetyltransferase n=1 Tax=Flagellimonas aurea TaxID=2915619 RepID=A0ABS3G8J9_9FLAO|nr:GNAT family N-acetyltransferase [Allomuricauda aurea]MBO0355603.1 GNAT family N-acetyltransferase [Allomuricauda aurea]
MEIKRIKKSESHLVIGLFDKYRVFYKQEPDLALAKEFIQARLNNDESIIFVAIKEGQPVGFTQLYPKYSSVRTTLNWILNDLYVETRYRKMGVGEKLISTAMDFAQKRGSKFVELSTAVDNIIAQGLYERIGFQKQTPETDFYTYRINLDR